MLENYLQGNSGLNTVVVHSCEDEDDNIATSGNKEKQRACKTCGKEGHPTIECPEIECHKCGKKGHISRHCNKCWTCGNTGHRKVDCPVYKSKMQELRCYRCKQPGTQEERPKAVFGRTKKAWSREIVPVPDETALVEKLKKFPPGSAVGLTEELVRKTQEALKASYLLCKEKEAEVAKIDEESLAIDAAITNLRERLGELTRQKAALRKNRRDAQECVNAQIGLSAKWREVRKLQIQLVNATEEALSELPAKRHREEKNTEKKSSTLPRADKESDDTDASPVTATSTPSEQYPQECDPDEDRDDAAPSPPESIADRIKARKAQQGNRVAPVA